MTLKKKQSNTLFTVIKGLVDQSKQEIAVSVNSTITMLYWHIGYTINNELSQNNKNGYGKQIVATLSRQLSWSHIKELIPVNDPLKREFYIQICFNENWSVRVFIERIQSMLYERTVISKKPEQIIQNQLEKLKTKKKLSRDLVLRPVFSRFLRFVFYLF